MTILDTFYLLFESDSSKLDKGLKESEEKADKLKEKLEQTDKASAKVGEGLFKMVSQVAGILGLGLSVGALVASIKSTAESYDELGKLAARFRDTAEAVDEFRDASSLLGISEETSTNALKSLDSAIQDTFLGLGRAGRVFEELGLEVTDAAGKLKPTTAVMGELAEKFTDMEKGTQIRVMERLGLDPAMLKLFNADLVALNKRMAEVDRAAGFNLEDAVRRSKEYTKASKDLSLEVNVLKMFLDKLSEGFKIAALSTKGLELATKYVRQFTDYLMNHRRLVEGVFIAVGSAILYFLVPAAVKGAIAVWAMIAPFALIGAAVVAVGAAFALAYDDIMNFIDGNDSLIGQIFEKYPLVKAIVMGMVDAFKLAWDALKFLVGALIDIWNDPAAAFKAFGDEVMVGMKAVGNFVMGIWDAIVGKIMWAIDSIKAGAHKLGSFVGLGGGETAAGVAAGQAQLGLASSTLLGAQTSNSIANSRTVSKSTMVQVDKIEVSTQATDAAGISKAIGGSFESQMRQAVASFDDGVLS